MPEIDVTFPLIDTELDAVAGGQASATLNIASLLAAGPTSATVTASGVTVTTLSVGGLAPSQSATVSGTFTAASA